MSPHLPAPATPEAPPRTAPSRTAPAAYRTPPPFPWHRVPFLALAALALLAGLDAATLLVGLPAPVTAQRLPEIHGPLMVLGFVGTLIALERAVALRRTWGFAAPALLGVGSIALLSPIPLGWGQALLVLGSIGLATVYVPLWRRQEDDAVLVQGVGASLAVGASVLWLRGEEIPRLLPWLVGFVVLTIAGERLELARLHIDRRRAGWLVALSGALVVATGTTAVRPDLSPLLGAALLGLVGWLAGADVARRTIRSTGLPRYTAACLLLGYGWLAVTGGIWLLHGEVLTGPGYDAAVHATFLGFTISMILAHAPVILPAILRRPLPYHPSMGWAAAALHGCLAVRVWLGDALGWADAWRMGAFGTVLALLGFVAVAAWSATRRPA